MESSSFWFTRLVAALEGAVAAGGAEAAVSRGKPLNQWPAHHHFHSLVLPGAGGRHPLVGRLRPLRRQMQVLLRIRYHKHHRKPQRINSINYVYPSGKPQFRL